MVRSVFGLAWVCRLLLCRLPLCWLLVCLPPWCGPASAASQPDQTPARWLHLADKVFQQVNPEQGLPNRSVMSLAQDGEGFIWIGTQDGLARWDGYRLRVFQPKADDPGSLPDNLIVSLHTDQSGQLWIGCNSAGLVRYDAQHERFMRVALAADPGQSMTVLAMLDDVASGGLWVATRNGLYLLDRHGQVVRHLHEQGSAADYLPSNEVVSLLRDQQGLLWVGTRRGLLVQQVRHGKPKVAPPLALRLWPSPLDSGRALIVSALGQSRDGQIWIGSDGQGLFALDPATSMMRTVLESGKTVFPEHLQFIEEVSPGEIWVGTLGQGIVVVDSRTLRTRRIRHDVRLPDSLIDDNVQSVLRDRTGLIWIGTDSGFTRHFPGQRNILSLFGLPGRPDGIADTDVFSARAMPDGKVWFGLESQGLTILDPLTSQIDSVRPGAGLALGRVYGLSSFVDGFVYLGCSRGLYRVDIHSHQIQHVNVQPRDPIEQVRALLHEGNQLWLGGRDGLWQVDLRSMKASRVPGAEALDKQLVIVLERAKDGSLWIGTRDNGLFRFDPAQRQLQHFRANPNDPKALASSNISSLLIDSRARLWVGTQGGGIAVMLTGQTAQPGQSGQPGQPQFRRLRRAQGLSNELVNKLLEARDGQIWASTDDGLARIDKDNYSVQLMRRADGVAVREYWVNSGAVTAQGEMMFGGTGGLSVVLPGTLAVRNQAPPMVITSLSHGGKARVAFPFNQAARKSRAGQAEALLELPADANSLAVEFAALDYAAPERNRYAYFMEGIDHDWIDSDPGRRLAVYSNLPPGDYRLHMRGANQYGVWSEQDAQLALRVLPAWYQTWWLRLGMTLLLVLLVLALVHGRTRYLRQRQHELEALVAERTGQLLQQAKIASLGTLTAGIAHEINNPSNFAHVGAFNLATQLNELNQFILDLAGSDASKEVLAAFQTRFDALRASLAAITEGTTRISNLVRDLRTYSRLDESSWKSVAIVESLQSTINLVRTQYADQVEIRCFLAHNPVLHCSPAQLNQVFMNLIVNACQAITARPDEVKQQDPGLLQIRSFIDQDCLVLEFEDNGGGIAKQHIDHIFDPFFTTKTVGDGMGMGLSISMGIVKKHRGNMTVNSVLGQGCCFTLRLPLGTDVDTIKE